MNNPKPLVSVLMAYFNNLQHVEASIASVYDQTYKNFELIVVDDCSPDPIAKQHIQELQNRYGFKLIRSTINQGASKAFQCAFEASIGDYITIISHDDLFDPIKIEHSINIIIEQDLDAIYCNGAYFHGDQVLDAKPFGSQEVLEALKINQAKVYDLISSRDNIGCLLTQGALYHRKIFNDLSWMRRTFLLDDWPFTIKVWQDYRTSYDDKTVYYYRHHDNNIHRNYWKWFPARVQTVGELVSPEKKLEVLSFLLADMGEFSLQNKKYDDAYRFSIAALMLAESQDNIFYAQSIISRNPSDKKNLMIESSSQKMTTISYRASVFFKITRVFLRIIIAFNPTRNARRKLRKKWGV